MYQTVAAVLNNIQAKLPCLYALVTVVYDSVIVSEILQTLVGNVQCADIFECKDKHLIHHNIMKKG